MVPLVARSVGGENTNLPAAPTVISDVGREACELVHFACVVFWKAGQEVRDQTGVGTWIVEWAREASLHLKI